MGPHFAGRRTNEGDARALELVISSVVAVGKDYGQANSAIYEHALRFLQQIVLFLVFMTRSGSPSGPHEERKQSYHGLNQMPVHVRNPGNDKSPIRMGHEGCLLPSMPLKDLSRCIGHVACGNSPPRQTYGHMACLEQNDWPIRECFHQLMDKLNIRSLQEQTVLSDNCIYIG